MHTKAVMVRATMSVRVCGEARAAGMSEPTPPATACEAVVMMVLSLKPTPVSVTTPITSPTLPAAAPTASAYLAPVMSASISTARSMRPCTFSSLINRGVATTPSAKRPTLTLSLSKLTKATTPSSACSKASRA